MPDEDLLSQVDLYTCILLNNVYQAQLSQSIPSVTVPLPHTPQATPRAKFQILPNPSHPDTVFRQMSGTLCFKNSTPLRHFQDVNH